MTQADGKPGGTAGEPLEDSVLSASAPAYIDYVLPGLIIMTAAAGLIGISTQASVAMTTASSTGSGRWPSSVRPFSSRIVASALQTLVSMVAVVGIAFALGFRSSAGLMEWLGAASNGPFPLIVLPLVGSGIVPTSTRPAGLRYFAEYQPFSPSARRPRARVGRSPGRVRIGQRDLVPGLAGGEGNEVVLAVHVPVDRGGRGAEPAAERAAPPGSVRRYTQS